MTILATENQFVGAALGTWQQQMKSAIRDRATLLQSLGLPAEAGMANQAEDQFPVFVPLAFLRRIRPGDPSDPLLRQVLPDPSEEQSPAHYSLDPLAESDAQRAPGLLQKYAGRALLVTNGTCAVHCRYCFRRHFPYSQTPKSIRQWQPALEELRADPSVEEIILSGGDPLTLVDSLLEELVDQLSEIPHLRRLRIHTRLPIMIPQRVTASLLNTISRFLASGQRQSIMVIHANHARELDDQVRQRLLEIRDTGTQLLNQSVLLRGVNDNLDALKQLSTRLLECGTLPYYLHQLDPVIGTSHFEVPRQQGESLIDQLRGLLPGYAVPRYVKELPGEPGKTIWR